MIDWSRYANFREEEFICHCGCGRAQMDDGFMDKLQAIRTEYGRPMKVTSGYRCPGYNARLKGGPEHPMGMAADIEVVNPDAMDLVTIALRYGLPRIGVSQRGARPRFIHLGGSTDLPRAIWSY